MAVVVDPMDEQVAFVPRAALPFLTNLERGYTPDPGRVHYAHLLDRVALATRGPLEHDPSRKQLIPYVVVTDGSQIFTLRRKRAQTEARLHDRLSIGVGGHIGDERTEAASAEATDLIRAGMLRELHEELVLTGPAHFTYRGLLNDDTSPVGQVHLGVIFSCVVAPGTVAVRETDKMEGSWSTLTELHERADQLETWSAILLDHLESWA